VAVRDAETEVSTRKILVVDSESQSRRELRSACEQDGYDVLEADNGADTLKLVTEQKPNLVLLELALPDMNGFDVCRELRKLDPSVPVIMVSTRSDEIDVVVGLEIGADDYVVKPIRIRELMARVAAHLRKSRADAFDFNRGRLEFKDLVIDVNERRVFRADKEVDLTHTEFDLLSYLAGNAGKVLSREKILNTIWGYEYPIETRVIDVHIRNLRRKIEVVPSRPFYILAVPGIGYRFTNAR
jgi:two-component system alkaline phosphatase synthesis response regulator PhoP